MAQPQQEDRNEIGFRNVQLLKTQSLGIGSYGAVCKAKCDDLLCAAKIIHPTLVDPTARALVSRGREHRLPISRFEQECHFLSSIKHPNIVQYLGTHQDPENRLPVLLMELMDESLTSFLEHSQQSIPYHIQITISSDIALALSFLHSNGIIHRDLSSNNVLMIGNSRAKVTDFGMAKLAGENHQATRVSLTQTPGADVYMSPEATQIPPVYSEKIDCFSHGVIGVQIMTRQFPNPGNRYNRIPIQDPRFPSGSIEVRISEIERRHEHISLIDRTHPLLAIALDCLKDNEGERPTAQEICGRLAALKQAPQFADSIQQQQATQQRATANETPSQQDLQAKDEEIQQLQQQLQDTVAENTRIISAKDHELAAKTQSIADSQRENQQLRQEKIGIISAKNREIAANAQSLADSQRENQQLKQEKTRLLEAKEIELQRLRQQARESEEMIAEFQRASLREARRISGPEELLKLLPPKPKARRGGAEALMNIHFTWEKCKTIKHSVYRTSNAVVIGNVVYCTHDEYPTQVYGYDTTTNNWFELLNCGRMYASIAVVDNILTVIGGEELSTRTSTNTLLSLQSKEWTQAFPSMPQACYYTCALSSGTALIVIGGKETILKPLDTVQVMDAKTKKWRMAARLPEPHYLGTATICGDRIYVLGADINSARSNRVFTCSLSALLQSSAASRDVWSRVADLPATRSTCVTFQGRLLAVGGEDSKTNKCTTAVHMYDSASNTWSVISHMMSPHWACSAAVLPGNKLIVVGGYESLFSSGSSIEVGTLD